MGNEFDFLEVYQYRVIDCKEYNEVENCDNSIYDYIGKLYEAMLPSDVKKIMDNFIRETMM